MPCVTGRLNIRIIQGKTITHGAHKHVDPYAVILVDGHQKCKTKFRSRTVNPKWDTSFTLMLDHAKHISIEIRNHATFGHSTSHSDGRDVCSRSILSNELFSSEEKTMWIDMKPEGKVEIKFTFVNQAHSDELTFRHAKLSEYTKDDPFSYFEYKFVKKEYCILDKLGKGGFGVVHRVVRLDNKKEYALKAIEKSRLTSQRAIQDMKREIEIWRLVEHPNIVQAFSHFQDDRCLYIASEILYGGELFDEIVKRECYTELDASTVMFQILDAVSYMHSLGIVHGDIKPENLLLDSRNSTANVKIADFGLSFTMKEPRPSSHIVGTPGYLSPEVVKHQKYTPGIDIWACGIVMYILLAGYPPFWDDNRNTLYSLILQNDHTYDSPWWDNTSNDAKNLIDNMLTSDPDRRITAKGALSHCWISTENVPSTIHRAITQSRLGEFNAKRKFKGAVNTILTASRLGAIRSNNKCKKNASNDIENCESPSSSISDDQVLNDPVEKISKMIGNMQDLQKTVVTLQNRIKELEAENEELRRNGVRLSLIESIAV